MTDPSELAADHPLREHRDAVVHDVLDVALDGEEMGNWVHAAKDHANDRLLDEGRPTPYDEAVEIIHAYDGHDAVDEWPVTRIIDEHSHPAKEPGEAVIHAAATTVGHAAIDALEELGVAGRNADVQEARP